MKYNLGSETNLQERYRQMRRESYKVLVAKFKTYITAYTTTVIPVDPDNTVFSREEILAAFKEAGEDLYKHSLIDKKQYDLTANLLLTYLKRYEK